jgi:signal transduction histidine kinase
MLELTQLDLGTAPFCLMKVDLAEIIEGVMTTTGALAQRKPIQLHTEMPAEMPMLNTDAQRIRQVILALLTNAVKYTEEGSIWLRVAVADGQVTISVEDTGMGIPPEERERIFADAIHRGAAGEGSLPGFGLAISRRVIERLGGRIWVEGRERGGSTLTFTLPISPTEA